MEKAFEEAIKAVEDNKTSDALTYLSDIKNINAKDEYGQTVLNASVMHRRSILVKWLLDNGANPNIPDNEGMYPINYAIAQHNIELLDLLVSSQKTNINVIGVKQMTPITYSISRGFVEGVEILVKKGAKTSVFHSKAHLTCVHFAPKNKKYGVEIIKLLSKAKDFDVNVRRDKYSVTPLMTAAFVGNAKACKLLMELGADPSLLDEDNRMALHYAVINGNVETLEALLEHKDKFNIDLEDKRCWRPLYIALDTKKYDMIETLLKAGAKDNYEHGGYLLKDAILNSDTKLLDILIRNGVDINNKEKNNLFTPLHYAVYKNDKKIIEMLLDIGADLGAKDVNGFSPFDTATKNGYQNFIEILEERHNKELILNPHWKKQNKDELVLSGKKEGSEISVQEIFNFEAKTRTIIEYSPEIGIRKMPARSFSKLPPMKVIEARRQLKALS